MTFISQFLGAEIDSAIARTRIHEAGDSLPISSEADLPSPSGNVITLVPGKSYDCVKLFTLTPGVSIKTNGASLTSQAGRFPNFGVVGDVAGPLVFQDAGECEVNNVIVRNLNAGGKCLNMVGDQFVTSLCSWECGNTIGDIDCDQFFINAGNFLGLGSATSGLTITGDVTAHSLNLALFAAINGPNIVFDTDMALASFGTIVLQGNAFILSGSLAGIEDQRPTKTGRVLLTDNQFNNSSAPLDGLDKDDPEITLKGNLGLPENNGNTDAGFDARQNSLDTLSLTDTVEADVVIDDWTILQSLWTVSPTTGKATNNNKDSRFRIFNIDSNVAKLLGGSQVVTFRMKLNGNIISTRSLTLTQTPQLLIMHAKAVVGDEDVISLTAITSAGDVDVTFEDTHQIG